MGKVIAYLQQPESIHALTALLLNTKAFGGFTVVDMVEWFQAQYGVTANTHELKERWRELAELGFAEHTPGCSKAQSERRVKGNIAFILTEKGEKMAQALMDCISYVGKLHGGEKNTR